MLLTALASVAAAAQQPPAVPHRGASLQATASVRIVSGERIRFNRLMEREDRPRRWRDTMFVLDGKPVAARFVEFE